LRFTVRPKTGVPVAESGSAGFWAYAPVIKPGKKWAMPFPELLALVSVLVIRAGALIPSTNAFFRSASCKRKQTAAPIKARSSKPTKNSGETKAEKRYCQKLCMRSGRILLK